MKPLPATYSANGWNYKLVQRTGDVAIYSQSMHPDLPAGGKAAAYEVFVVQKRKAREMFGCDVEASEAVPSPSQWGAKAWTCHTLERAKVVFREILAGIRDVRRAKGIAVAD